MYLPLEKRLLFSLGSWNSLSHFFKQHLRDTLCSRFSMEKIIDVYYDYLWKGPLLVSRLNNPQSTRQSNNNKHDFLIVDSYELEKVTIFWFDHFELEFGAETLKFCSTHGYYKSPKYERQTPFLSQWTRTSLFGWDWHFKKKTCLYLLMFGNPQCWRMLCRAIGDPWDLWCTYIELRPVSPTLVTHRNLERSQE